MDETVKYNPIIYQLPNINDSLSDIVNTKSYIDINDQQPMPLLSLGFTTNIYDLKNKTSVNKNVNKLDISVANRLDTKIKNYENSLAEVTKLVFNIDQDKSHPILSRAFYKLWEIIRSFNLIESNNNFCSAHLAEAPGSFLQSVMYYREMFFNKELRNDQYHAISLHPESDNKKNKNDYVPLLDENFMNRYNKSKNIVVHQTKPLGSLKDNNDIDNGDLLKLVTRKNFISKFNKHRANLVTADGGFPWKNENLQEQEALPLIISEILIALQIQEKGGSFVCKIYETFTTVMVKLLYILRSCYEHVFIIKPLTSHDTNSEKYIVCHKFKYDLSKDNKDINKLIDSFNSLLDKYNKYNSLVYINDIYQNLIIKNNFTNIIKSLNCDLRDLQLRAISKMLGYIHGTMSSDQYEKDYVQQVNYTKLWVDLFYSGGDEINHILTQLIKATLQRNKERANNLHQQLTN
jgi:23S rRNA U2552 (ribose-2'-O)-methylase RlmE/FtsJ